MFFRPGYAIALSILALAVLCAALIAGGLAWHVAAPTVPGIVSAGALGFLALVLACVSVGILAHLAFRATERTRAYFRLAAIGRALVGAPANAADLEAERARLEERLAQLEGRLTLTGADIGITRVGGTHNVPGYR